MSKHKRAIKMRENSSHSCPSSAFKDIAPLSENQPLNFMSHNSSPFRGQSIAVQLRRMEWFSGEQVYLMSLGYILTVTMVPFLNQQIYKLELSLFSFPQQCCLLLKFRDPQSSGKVKEVHPTPTLCFCDPEKGLLKRNTFPHVAQIRLTDAPLVYL